MRLIGQLTSTAAQISKDLATGNYRPEADLGYSPNRGDSETHIAGSLVQLGRATNMARIEVGVPLDHDPLPPLLDATLAGMAVTGFVLTGIEYIDGCAYAQSWWCREG